MAISWITLHLYTINLRKPLNVQEMSLSTPGTEKSPPNLGGNP